MTLARHRWATGCLAASIIVLAACSSSPAAQVRPFPVGDSVAASRPLDPSVPTVPAAVDRPIIPAHLYVPAVAINSSVLSLGTVMEPDPFLGGKEVASFQVPPDLARAGWWSDGPRVGGPGMAVLLGHSQVGGGHAVFNRIGELKRGATIVVDDQTGRSRLKFAVSVVVLGIPKNDDAALQKALAANAPTADLALITCSGNFDSSVSESVDNTVVFARRA